MKLFKRITSFLTACVMMMGAGNTLSYGGENVWAVDSEDVKIIDISGKCGDYVYWELSDGILDIYGTGDMSDFTLSPWRYVSGYSIKNIYKIIIHEGVASIGNSAFRFIDSLTSITIPDSVSSIGGSAFDGTPWLEEQRKRSPFVTINNILVDARTCKDSITIPNSVSSIGDYAFSKCQSLTSVTIPDSVSLIGNYAFYLCESLANITIPDSISSIRDSAFSGCTHLENVYYSGTQKQWNKICIGYENSPLTSATIHCEPESAYGDVNGDGVVTAIDMSELILILIGKKTEYDKDSADTDSDSLITISDLVKLRMYILEQSIA